MFHTEAEWKAAYDAAHAVIQVNYSSGYVEFVGNVNRSMERLAQQVACAVIRAGDSVPDIMDDDLDSSLTGECTSWAS